MLLVGLFFCLKHYRDSELEGTMSYEKALGTGIVIHIWIGFFSGIGYVINALLNPKLHESVLEKQYQGMVDQGKGDAEIEMAMELIEILMSLWLMPFWVIFGTAFMGVFISLVVGAIVQKKAQ